MKILYAEDSRINVRAMHKMADAAGCELLTAGTGNQALALLNEQPDLVIVDLGLPDMTGFALIAQIRANCSTLPIVAVTASLLLEDRSRAMAAGCMAFFTRPLDYESTVVWLRRLQAQIEMR